MYTYVCVFWMLRDVSGVCKVHACIMGAGECVCVCVCVCPIPLV